MKRLCFAITLILAGTALVFAQTKIVLATAGGDNDKAVFEQLIKTIQPKIPGITVEVMLLADFDKTVTTRLVGNQPLDILTVSESVHQFSERNQLVDLNASVKSAKIDLAQRFGAGKDLYAKDGKLFALPLRGGPMVVYVNTDVVKAKPQLNWTFADFAAAAKAAYKPGATKADTVWGFVPAGSGVWWPWYTSFIYSAGGSLVDGKGKPSFDNPKTIAGLKNYNSFINDAKVAPSPQDMADLGQNSPDPVFNSGHAGMIMTGWWNVGSLKDATFNWDVATIPNDKGVGTVIFGQGLSVSATSKNKEAAFKVIAALTDVEAQAKIVDLVWDIPANVQILNSDAFLKAAWAKKPLDMKAVADAISKGTISLPYSSKWNKMHDTIGNVVNEMLKGKTTPEAAAARIQKDLNEQVFNR
jgi:multiple sugar transport system substrate-binding protein